MSFRCLDFTFDVVVDRRELALRDLVEDLYAPFASERAPDVCFTLVRWCVDGRPDQFAVYANETPTATTYDGALALAHLVWEVNQRAIGTGSEHLLVHAAAAERDGRAVLLCAPSGWGKSTLVAGLLRDGMRYLTDDVTVVDASGRVRPYPKPLGVARGTRAALGIAEPVGAVAEFVGGEGFVRLAELDGAVGSPSRPALVVIPHYRPGAGAAVERVTPKRALAALSEQSFNLDGLGAEGWRRLTGVVGSAECRTLEYSNLSVGVATVRDWLDSRE